MSLTPDAPHMKVMNVVHSLNASYHRLDLLHLHSTGRSLEQDVQGFSDDAETGPQDQNANAN